MSVQVIGRDRLGELTRVGQGGQGVVYRAPKARTRFAAEMVYKEYRSAVLAGIDFGALAAMPALVEDALTYAQAERLVSVAAWPCALVGGDGPDGPDGSDGSGGASGFVMPAIPEAFFTTLVTAKGTSSTTAEFQHLLNHASVLAARGIAVSDAQRYALLREAASSLAFLHKHGVCVGDISPKNLLYSLVPHEAVYFIDCDAMRVNGVSALAQVETPGWEVPAGEELATIYSDTYKLGLLALRLLAGDQDTSNVGHVPVGTPGLLRQLIVDTLSNPPERRPLPEAWTYVLGHAIEEAQHRASVSVAPVAEIALPAPEVPVVHTRPVAGAKPPPPQPTDSSIAANKLAAQSSPPTGPLATSTPGDGNSAARTALLVTLGVVIVVVLAVIFVELGTGESTHTTAASTTQVTYSSPSPTYSPPAPTYSSPSPTDASVDAPPPSVYVPPPPVYTPPPTYVPPPPKEAAIAISDNGGYGWANDASSQQAAKDQAVSKCEQIAGGNCRVVAWTGTGAPCLALADGGNGNRGWASGPSQGAAEQASIGSSGARILTSFCT